MSAQDRERNLGERLFLTIALALAAGVGTSQILYGERFAGHGIGTGDPRFYVWMVEDFRGVVLGGKLDSYRLQRILPPAIVSGTLAVLGLPRSQDMIVRVFSVYNLTLLLATVLLWNGIARTMAISLAGRWLGFLLLACNFAWSRVPFYNPVLTDTFALALGALVLYGFVRSNAALVLGGVVASAFTWPALPGLGALLFLLPRASLTVGDGRAASRGWRAATLIAALYCGQLAWGLRDADPRSAIVQWLPASVLIAVAYLLGAFAPLLRPASLYRVPEYLRALRWRRLLPLGLAGVAVVGFVRTYSSGAPAPLNSLALAEAIVRESVMRPGLALVAHSVYLGLVPLVLIVFWDRACRAVHALGISMTLFTAATVALALGSESRHLVHALLPLVLLAVLAVEDLRLPKWAPWVLTAMALVGSKLWFGINHEGFRSRSDAYSYPAQYWWMNLGPWMAEEMWALQGALALAALLLVVWVRVASRPLDESERNVVWPTNRAVLAFPLAAVAIGALILLVEIPSRWILASRSPRGELVTRPDATRGWANVPGARVLLRRPEFEVELAINARGVRGPERSSEKPAGTRRVVLLGGSFAEGYGVPEERSLRALLERELHEQGCGPVEVINLGVAGYGTEQQRRFFEVEGRRYRPDAVAVLFHADDLVAGLRQQEPKEPTDEEQEPTDDEAAVDEFSIITAGVPPRLRDARLAPLVRWHGSAFLRLVSNFTLEHWPRMHRALGRLGVVDLGPPPLELWPYGPREEMRAARRQVRQSLARLAAQVREQGAGIVLAYAPAFFEISDPAWQALMQRYQMSPRFWRPTRVGYRLAKVAAGLDIPTTDLRDALRAAELASRRPYFVRAGQWNETGHATAAQQLGPALAVSLGCGAVRGHGP